MTNTFGQHACMYPPTCHLPAWECEVINGLPSAAVLPPAFLADYDDEPNIETGTLVVTHLDGAETQWPETRYLARLDRGAKNPIVRLDTYTLEVENMEQTFTIMNVRSYRMEF